MKRHIPNLTLCALAVVIVAAGIWFSVQNRGDNSIVIEKKVETVAEKQVTGPKVVIMANGERGSIKQVTPVVISWASSSEKCTLVKEDERYIRSQEQAPQPSTSGFLVLRTLKG
jgi:hypothetical protein